MRKRIYISGQITGLDLKTAKEYFQQMEDRITEAGHIAVNPLKLHADLSAPWIDLMMTDIDALFCCDGIIMLDNWMQSNGARIEHKIAIRRGMQIFYPATHHKLLGEVVAKPIDEMLPQSLNA